MTADQAEMERLVCVLTPRPVRRTRAEVSMASKKMRNLWIYKQRGESQGTT